MRGPDLERRQAVEYLGLAIQRAEVRPEPLVGAAHQEVGVEGADIDRAVRRVGDRIDVGQGADLVGARDDVADRVDRPDRVAGETDGDQLRMAVQLALEVLEVEGQVVLADVDLAHGHPAVGGHRLPGADVGLVVEGRDHDLVARLERRADAPTDVQGQRRHVVAELDLLGARRAKEVGHGRVCLLGHRVAELARDEGAARVGVAVRVVVADGVDDALRDLRAAGTVEEDGRPAVRALASQGRELGAQRLDIERGGRHGAERSARPERPRE